jgi:cytochrome c oxidase assembly protein subunit 11
MAASGRRKASTAIVLGAVALGMVGLSFASVPLYRLFCQVTGYGGTTQTAATAPVALGERVITVRFNADLARGMPWRFRPAQGEVRLRVGEVGLAFYSASNPTGKAVTGTATYNVTPQKAGPYFNKIACFCFDEQTLQAGESVQMPVSFFVDPEISEDPNLDDVTTITLSYTFFETERADEDAGRRLSERAAGEAGGPRLN